MADNHMHRADRTDHDLVDKRFGALLRELAVEMLDEHEVDAEPSDLSLLDAKRGQPERLAAGQEDVARMRLEGQHRAWRAACAGETGGLGDQRCVSLVQPV